MDPIFGNPFKLEQVLLNLISNARDALEEKAATDSNTISKEIRISSYCNDGKIIVSGSTYDNTVKIWSVEGKLLKNLKSHNADGTCVAFSPNGQYFASGSSDKTIKIWAKDGLLIQTITGHNSSVNSLAFSPDSRCIASGSGVKYSEETIRRKAGKTGAK